MELAVLDVVQTIPSELGENSAPMISDGADSHFDFIVLVPPLETFPLLAIAGIQIYYGDPDVFPL